MKAIQKANHAYSKCMLCKENPPDNDAIWQDSAGGLHRAWMCSKCFPGWYGEKGEAVIYYHKVDGGVSSRYRPIRHSPKEKRGPSTSSGHGKVAKGDLLRVNGFEVTLGDIALAWVKKAERFTSAPWSTPESTLSASDFAEVCLIDLNPAGEEKKKALCELPIKSTPDGPVNLNALRNAAARLPQTDAPQEAKRAAARRLVTLMRAADLEPGEATLNAAGIDKASGSPEGDKASGSPEGDKVAVEKSWAFDIIKADEEKRLLYGVPLEPETKDSQNDTADQEEIEKAAHNFMIKSRMMDLQHKEVVDPKKATPVESYIALVDMEIGGKPIKKGSWVVVTKIFDDKIWQQVKSGEIRGYSIRGFGKRKPAS